MKITISGVAIGAIPKTWCFGQSFKMEQHAGHATVQWFCRM
jgi:hypothetical protein